MKNCFALIDCNNFFVSCERLFRPDLRNKPVIVLSNNDGCVISRSNEAKSLGIPMGVPLFKIKHLVKKYNIQIFSTNFNLYLDISKRVNAILSTFSPYHENYSIDESFLDLTGFKKQYNIYDYCHNINYIVTKSTGIPVCVGAGPTKTLAKIANYGAKKGLILGGVLTIDTEEERIQLLKKTPLYDVWGIGKSFFEKLSKDFNLKTAYDLSLYDPYIMQRKVNINVAKIIRELNGESCIPFEEVPKPQKQIMKSRTFGKTTSCYQELLEILAGFTTIVAQTLRTQKQFASNFGIFIQTNLHSTTPNTKQYSNSISFSFEKPTNETTILLNTLSILLKKIFKPNFLYYKAGVILQGLTEHQTWQTDLFNTQDTTPEKDAKLQKLQQAINLINAKKQNTIFYAVEGTKNKHISKQEHLSPNYTTKWEDVPKVF